MIIEFNLKLHYPNKKLILFKVGFYFSKSSYCSNICYIPIKINNNNNR